MAAHLLPGVSHLANSNAGGLVAGGFGLICVLFVIVLSFAVVALQIWMIVDAATNNSLDSTMKLVWILVIIFVPLGFVIYFFVARKAKTDQGNPGFEVKR